MTRHDGHGVDPFDPAVSTASTVSTEPALTLPRLAIYCPGCCPVALAAYERVVTPARVSALVDIAINGSRRVAADAAFSQVVSVAYLTLISTPCACACVTP